MCSSKRAWVHSPIANVQISGNLYARIRHIQLAERAKNGGAKWVLCFAISCQLWKVRWGTCKWYLMKYIGYYSNFLWCLYLDKASLTLPVVSKCAVVKNGTWASEVLEGSSQLLFTLDSHSICYAERAESNLSNGIKHEVWLFVWKKTAPAHNSIAVML